ncbi:N-acetyltransferase [Filobacillus milosensis]|uniref:N-acetyltransferase n=1 Tax=Filobacillus milosensis TaxID=94137 RepID=A0A4Y8ILM4_9BACI|nr:N-acetyltransferase [Filobacillus milosensis]
MPIIDSERILLRPFTLKDAPRVVELAGDKRVAETTLTIPHPYYEHSAIDWINTHQERAEQNECLIFAIEEKNNHELIGAVTLRLDDAHRRGELAYWLGVPYWGRGYVSESIKVVIEFGFNELELNRIYATVMKKNLGSIKVLRKNGFRYEGTFPQHDYKWGTYEDVDCYGLLREDYQKLVQFEQGEGRI